MYLIIFYSCLVKSKHGAFSGSDEKIYVSIIRPGRMAEKKTLPLKDNFAQKLTPSSKKVPFLPFRHFPIHPPVCQPPHLPARPFICPAGHRQQRPTRSWHRKYCSIQTKSLHLVFGWWYKNNGSNIISP